MSKGRHSGMPAVEQWESYFDAAGVLESLGLCDVRGDAIEFGCGYGTFSIPAAHGISGTLHALDIDPLMVAATRARAARDGADNVSVERRDFLADGCGRPSESAALALLFNILHVEHPLGLLREAHRAVRHGGMAAIIHWNHDARTPRGPPLAIRPRPEQCRAWGEEAGFSWTRSPPLRGSPWHWGMVLERT